jgi:2-phospho-L-lactate/phosphoenolpyruvate guanylyltransferase
VAGVVVPFRGHGGKSRLGAPLGERLGLAMLGDVLVACTAVGRTVLVTGDEDAAALAQELGASVIPDPGGGQGAAVAAGLAALDERPLLVVNADLPRATARDLLTLLGAAPPEGMALVPARDGTTNALVLPAPHVFKPLYGAGSAQRFRQQAQRLGLELVEADIPGLVEDVDEPEDLARLDGDLGPRTRAALSQLAGLAR